MRSSQTDDILFKPIEISALAEAITGRLSQGPERPQEIATLATLLDRSTQRELGGEFKLAVRVFLAGG
jgi:hypothetical protein